MSYVYLSLSVILIASSSIIGGTYTRKNTGRKSVSSLYNLLFTFSALIGWGIISLFSFTFNATIIWYSLLFGIFYVITNVSFLIALKNGPVSLTSLFLQLSLIGVTIWGFIFWNDEITLIIIIGLILAVISLIFILYHKNEQKINSKWLLACLVMFISNLACTIIQKEQALNYDESCGNMFMFFALIFSVIFSFFLFMFGDKSDTKIIIKTSSIFPLLAGILNALQNFFVILMATKLPSGVVYPVLSIGGLAISILVSLILFKEKLKWTQWLGIVLGTISILLLQI